MRHCLTVLAPSTGDSIRDEAAAAHAEVRLNGADFDVVRLDDLVAEVEELPARRRPLGLAGLVSYLVGRVRETDGLVVLPGAENDETACRVLAALEGSGMERRTVPGWLTWKGQQRYMSRLRHPAGKGRVDA